MIYTCKSWWQIEKYICNYSAEYTPTLILQTYLKDTGKVSTLWTGLQTKVEQILCCKELCVTFKSLSSVPTVSGTTIDPLSGKRE